jgi:hypothetical protein
MWIFGRKRNFQRALCEAQEADEPDAKRRLLAFSQSQRQHTVESALATSQLTVGSLRRTVGALLVVVAAESLLLAFL